MSKGRPDHDHRWVTTSIANTLSTNPTAIEHCGCGAIRERPISGAEATRIAADWRAGGSDALSQDSARILAARERQAAEQRQAAYDQQKALLEACIASPIFTMGGVPTVTPLCPELDARIAALEAENARLTDLTNKLVDWVTGQWESQNALNRISAWLAENRRQKGDVGP